MTLKFESIIPRLQIAITEKLCIKDYVNFEMASKHSKEIAEGIKRRIFINSPREHNEGSMAYKHGEYFFNFDRMSFLDSNRECLLTTFLDLKIRVSMDINICDDFTNEFCLAATQFFRISKSKAGTLSFLTIVNCSSLLLNDFLEFARPSCFFYYPIIKFPISVESCRIPAIRKVPRLMLYGGPLDDKDLFSFKARFLTLTYKNKITASGINKYIKEFLSGLRTFNSIRVTLTDTVDLEKVLEDIPYSIKKMKTGKCIDFGTRQTMLGTISLLKSGSEKYDTIEITNGVGVPWP